jgi:hypothetical protein
VRRREERGVIYAALTVWAVLIVFMAIGVHALWSRLVGPTAVGWALLPGTVVSEMFYIFGCLITGGEVHRARLLPGGGGRKGGDAEPSTEVRPRLKHIGPLLAAMLAVLACADAIVLAHAFLGEPVIKQFLFQWFQPLAALPQAVPTSAEAFWQQLGAQTSLLRRMTETWGKLDWLQWRVPLFVYLTVCFSVRLAPLRRDLRYTLGAVVVLAGIIAGVGAVSERFDGVVERVWPLLTYVWAMLLFLLAVTLLLHGAVALARVLAGKAPKPA